MEVSHDYQMLILASNIYLNVLYLNVEPILLQIRVGLFSSINVFQIPTSNISVVREVFLLLFPTHVHIGEPTGSYCFEEGLVNY